MPSRRIAVLAVAAVLGASGTAAAQEATPGTAPLPGTAEPVDRIGRVDAVEYMRGLLANEPYDPRYRERALNGAPELGEHWRSSVFDGRRTRETYGTGLHVPDFLRQGDAE